MILKLGHVRHEIEGYLKMCMRLALLSLLLLIGNSPLRAEGGCPAGMIPYSGTDITSCGPIPDGYYKNDVEDNHAQSSAPVWNKTWGAISFSKTSGAVGVATGLSSKKAATQAALADCRKAGGGDCDIAMAYHNQCVAIAWGPKHRSTNTAETTEIASNLALEGCGGEINQCKVVYSNCSVPVRTQ